MQFFDLYCVSMCTLFYYYLCTHLYFTLTVYVPGGRYDYLTLSGKQHVERLSCDWTDRNALSHIQVTLPVSQHAAPLKRLTAALLTPPDFLFAFRERAGWLKEAE